MTNPFKKIAAALLLRGAVFAASGLYLIAKALPPLLDTAQSLNVSGAVIGAFLLAFGVADLVQGLQRLTRMRKDKLDTPLIDYAYGRRGVLPPNLMNADENPNEAGQATLIEWVARVFPKIAYLPYPYTGALHSVLVAVGLGAAGLLIYLLLRVVMAGTLQPAQLASMLDWYLWSYYLVGFGFWAAISRFGFRRALLFESKLLPGRIVTLFLALLVGSVVLAVGMAKGGTQLAAPPDLGPLTAILWLGSLVVTGAAGAITVLRGRRAPEQYSVHRDEEFFTVGMHPTDVINVIKSFTGKIGPGSYVHLGSWNPEYKEHTAVNAGEFQANLNAESAIKLNDRPNAHPEAKLGTVLAWAGIAMTLLAGVMLWNVAGATLDTPASALLSLRIPIALAVFGFLLYRLGIIPVAELEWTSVITTCRIEGTFQTQAGMALMSAGEQTLKGSVLTSATVQPKCAFLTSVGFLQPGLARNTIVRLIDRVEPASQVSGDLLAAIRHQATRIMNAGAPTAPRSPALHALPDQAHFESDEPGETVDAPA